MKLSLGTVQFGIPYGINNASGVPAELEIEKILSLADKSGIDILDTASAYGNAEEKIGKLSNGNFNIISKFSKVADISELERQLDNTLLHLRKNRIYGYMAHNADNLIENPELWKALVSAKENGKVDKIGASFYVPEQLTRLLDMKIVPDLVQLPYSMLDKKFDPFLSLLKNAGVEIHIRSVFLQGLYFMSPKKMPANILPLQPLIQELSNISAEFRIPIGAIALKYVIQNPLIDKVVIGVDSELQLKQNIQMLSHAELPTDLTTRINNIRIEDKNLLNPANW